MTYLETIQKTIEIQSDLIYRGYQVTLSVSPKVEYIAMYFWGEGIEPRISYSAYGDDYIKFIQNIEKEKERLLNDIL